ncbi:ATP-binding protein [Chitinophaga pinensis]
MELVANAWDAGATEVNIEWPESDGQKFSIADNVTE